MNRLLTILLAMMMMATAPASAQGDGKGDRGNGGGPRKEADGRKKKKEKTPKEDVKETLRVYVYGVAISPSDSVVYMTDELILDSAMIYKKSKFLYGRELLSRQLHDHLAQQGVGRCISSVTFAKTIKDLDKRYLKQAKKLRKRGYLIKNVSQTDFRFVAVKAED